MGNCGGVGTCGMIRDVYTAEIDPVCGCDSKVYFNACKALVTGVSLTSKDKDCGGGSGFHVSCVCAQINRSSLLFMVF